jgi:hypothetical protein
MLFSIERNAFSPVAEKILGATAFATMLAGDTLGVN